MALAIINIQEEVKEWIKHNFPNSQAEDPLIGMMEELGELSHAFLKAKQCIRSGADPHAQDLPNKARDAIGDLMIFTIHFCILQGWNLQTILSDTWSQVKKRDWKAHPKTGISND